MPRLERFTFLCNENERRLITDLAKKLRRSQSDAVRFIVINAARELIRVEGGEGQTAGIEHRNLEGIGEPAAAG